MKIFALTSTIAFLASLGAATAAPLPVQTGVSADSGAIQVRDTKKKAKAKKSQKGMQDMKGMDHSKMRM